MIVRPHQQKTIVVIVIVVMVESNLLYTGRYSTI